ncbi:hypothetical protein ASD50_16220 [Mesorhizobium sp. Root552]|jgi:uncharacterized protein (DUF1330 family)|uniref:DUF1330 domain-containing protein n=1 Tax=Mesorhizobium sp. Root552 TaxID=1736555 RepID=UPI0007022D00|nr:DUF1330 domain-containing protein [Mesorhizobium sp. Root552]KQZ31071.1 hypothetical protein ASD50_16220 [Mesorhizobium sp. Root552]
MTAYVVATMAIHDPQTYRKYTDLTPPLVKRHGGRFLTRGDEVTTTKGEAFKERMVLLEFPDKAHAEAWLSDPEYVEACKFRDASAAVRVLIQESRGNTENPDPKL